MGSVLSAGQVPGFLASQFRAHVPLLPAVRKILQLDAHASPPLCGYSSTDPTPRPRLICHPRGPFPPASPWLPVDSTSWGHGDQRCRPFPGEPSTCEWPEDSEIIQPDVLLCPRKEKSLACRQPRGSFHRRHLTWKLEARVQLCMEMQGRAIDMPLRSL